MPGNITLVLFLEGFQLSEEKFRAMLKYVEENSCTEDSDGN